MPQEEEEYSLFGAIGYVTAVTLGILYIVLLIAIGVLSFVAGDCGDAPPNQSPAVVELYDKCVKTMKGIKKVRDIMGYVAAAPLAIWVLRIVYVVFENIRERGVQHK